MMVRKLIAVVLIAGATATASGAMAEPVLREQIIVKGPLVTLGDLFADAGAVAHEAVFRSPDIGTEGTVAAVRVQSAAKKHGLEWHNPGGVEQVKVKRPSRHVTLDEIERLIAAAATAELKAARAEDVQVKLAASSRAAHLDPAIAEPLEVKRFDLYQGGGFRALIGFAGRADASELSYSGHAFEVIEIAAPARDIARGEVLLEGDVEIVKLPKSRSAEGIVQTADRLIGMAAKQALAAGKPVREADLERPRIIEKNAIVTIVYQTPGLVVKAQGKTLGDAALGDTVNVMNTQSKRVLQATVIAPGVVSVAVATRVSAVAPQAAGQPNLVR